MSSQMLDAAKHLGKAVQPGILYNLERAYSAYQGEYTASGKQYKKGEEAARWLGWRVDTLDPKVALYYRAFEFNDGIREASGAFNKSISTPNEITREEIRGAMERTVAMRAEAFRTMTRIVSAARNGGMSDGDIIKTLTANHVTEENAHALVKGRVPDWMPSEQSLDGAMEKARLLYGKEKAAEFRRRYQEVMKGYAGRQ